MLADPELPCSHTTKNTELDGELNAIDGLASSKVAPSLVTASSLVKDEPVLLKRRTLMSRLPTRPFSHATMKFEFPCSQDTEGNACRPVVTRLTLRLAVTAVPAGLNTRAKIFP